MTHDCQCHSGRRRLRIRFAEAGAVPAVVHTAAAKLGWETVADGRSFDLDIGGGARFSSPAELAVYLREIAAEAFDGMDAQWIDGEGQPAEPLSKNLAGFDANPLYALLEERRLATWFQPVFDRDLRVWGYECLVRAHDADGELITPDRLIGWARDENLLFYFDRICRETHVANAAVAQATADARFLINFLPTTIYEPTVCLRTTLKAVEQAGLAKERVIFGWWRARRSRMLPTCAASSTIIARADSALPWMTWAPGIPACSCWPSSSRTSSSSTANWSHGWRTRASTAPSAAASSISAGKRGSWCWPKGSRQPSNTRCCANWGPTCSRVSTSVARQPSRRSVR